MSRVYVVDDDAQVRSALARLARAAGLAIRGGGHSLRLCLVTGRRHSAWDIPTFRGCFLRRGAGGRETILGDTLLINRRGLRRGRI